jgi:hypothetical protein
LRWYCKYGISYRDLAAMMAERGAEVNPTTIMRWIHRYAPELETGPLVPALWFDVVARGRDVGQSRRSLEVPVQGCQQTWRADQLHAFRPEKQRCGPSFSEESVDDHEGLAIRFDYADLATYDEALNGVDRVFLMEPQPPTEPEKLHAGHTSHASIRTTGNIYVQKVDVSVQQAVNWNSRESSAVILSTISEIDADCVQFHGRILRTLLL